MKFNYFITTLYFCIYLLRYYFVDCLMILGMSIWHMKFNELGEPCPVRF